MVSKSGTRAEQSTEDRTPAARSLGSTHRAGSECYGTEIGAFTYPGGIPFGLRALDYASAKRRFGPRRGLQ
jgi:hypothetical protein